MKIIERNLTTKISLEVLNLLARNEQNYASPNHLKIILRIHTYHKNTCICMNEYARQQLFPRSSFFTPFWPFVTPFWHADYFVYMSVCPSFKPI